MLAPILRYQGWNICGIGMVRKEYQIESECKRIARARGWVIWKNVPDGCKGIPDTSLLSPCGEFIMVEFKRDNKAHIRPEQIVWQKRFPDNVFIISSVQEFENLLISHDGTQNEWLPIGLAKMKVRVTNFCKSVKCLNIKVLSAKNVKMSKMSVEKTFLHAYAHTHAYIHTHTCARN